MESLSNDLYSIIIKFLSVKDRIILREVNNNFQQIINKKNLIILKLENNLKNIFLSTDPAFSQYVDINRDRVHKLFRVTNYTYDKCIDQQCREKKMGYIHYSNILKYPNCYKRKIHYCVDCFNKWR